MVRASLLAAAVAALLLAACGEEDADQPAAPAEPGERSAEPAEPRGEEEAPEVSSAQPVADEDLIRGTVTAVLSDPDSGTICTEMVSERLLTASYGNLQGCLDGRPQESLAADSKVSDVVVEGSSATAVAEADGGVYDETEIEIELVRLGGRWQVDSMRADVPVGP